MTQIVRIYESDYRDILRFDDEGGSAVDIAYEVLPDPIEIKPIRNSEEDRKKATSAGQQSR